MPNFNIDADRSLTYDAIVVGSGISGGWAAKELTEKGLKTLVLERGPIVEHVKDYPTANFDPWDMELRGGLTAEERAGLKDVVQFNNGHEMGYGIHEMGTARMGRDPKTSVLNGHNQVWGAENVFVTDGACMTSAACVNPSLTYMALTARAADHAVSELNKQNL